MEAGLPHQEMKMAEQAIWEGITQATPKELITGYSELIQRQIDQDGSNAFLLTFMFKPLAGSTKSILIQMNTEIQRVYSTFVTRVVRNPRSETNRASLPLLLTVPDRPVSKLKKQKLADLKINGGLHLHGILCVPWNCRLKVDVPTHFEAKKAMYVKNRLMRIDAEPIFSARVNHVVDYAFKALKNGNATSDDIRIYQ
jgi:hypothetical protein